MDLQINKSKAEQWVEQGAPNHALTFLGDQVKSMNEFAEDNDILNKSEDEGANPDANNDSSQVDSENNEADIEAENNDVTEDSTDNDTDVDKSTGTDEVPTADVMEALNKSFSDTVAAAIAAYHEEVVAPLVKELATLKSVTNATNTDEEGNEADAEDSTANNEELAPESAVKSLFAAFMSEDFLPTAAMTAKIKEQYASQAAQDEDVTVSDEDAEIAAAHVDKSIGATEGTTPGHAFNDF